MHKTRNSLSLSKRKKSAQQLQTCLSSLLDLALQAKQAHWNLKGANFIALHELFDKINSELLDFADLNAERIAALGGTPDGTIGTISKETLLKTYPKGLVKSKDHLTFFANNLAIVGRQHRDAIELSAEEGDLGTSDLFTEVSRGLDHLLWLIEAHLQG